MILKFNTFNELDFISLDEQTIDIMTAINKFRCGQIVEAVKSLGYECPKDMTEWIHVVSYYENAARFKEQILEIAYDLEKAGL